MKPLLYFVSILFCLPSGAQTGFADTFKLLELKQTIKSYPLIGLGETGHGYASINERKAAFVNLLHQELNFKAIAFESSFTQSIISFMKEDVPDERAKSFLYSFWNTPVVKACLKTFIDKEKDLKPLVIGFDIQEDCRFSKLSTFLIEKQLISVNLYRLKECDSVLSFYIGKNFSRKKALTNHEYLLLIQNYDLIDLEISASRLDSLQVKLIRRSLQNRKWLCKYLSFSAVKDKMYFRDSLMADNVKWIRRELYPDNKFILWAADTHIAKKTTNRNNQWMGDWLSSWFKDQYFAVSFQKGYARESFNRPETSYKYATSRFEKFDLIFHLDKLKKIMAEEWYTACE